MRLNYFKLAVPVTIRYGMDAFRFEMFRKCFKCTAFVLWLIGCVSEPVFVINRVQPYEN